MRFFSFPDAESIGVGRSAGIRSGNSTCGKSPTHASAEILQAELWSRPLCARAGKRRSSEASETQRRNGGSRFCARYAGGGAPSCAFVPASWRIRRRPPGGGIDSLRFRMRSLRKPAGRRPPGREIPHAPQTRPPRPPKHGGRSGQAGDRRPNGSNGGRGAGFRMPMRMRGTRDARYLQTLPQPYSYAEYSYADIFLRRICLCSYYVGHNATAAYLPQLIYRICCYRIYCYCSYILP